MTAACCCGPGQLAVLVLVAGALALTAALPDAAARDGIAALLALAMGVQNAVARRLAVPDLTTTVLTMPLTGIAADLRGANHGRAGLGRRVLAVVTAGSRSPSGGRVRGARGDYSRGGKHNATMRRLYFMAPILACVTLAGCSGGTASSAPTGPAGSPGNPQVFSCAEESFLGGTMPPMPEPGDLAVGPLVIFNATKLATGDPAGWGEHGSYKIPIMVTMGSTVTVTIDPPARGHVVIDNPYALHGVTAATYHSCAHVAGFFAQGFAFTDGRIRGCVPLEVRVGGQARVQRVTLSLFAGSCAA